MSFANKNNERSRDARPGKAAMLVFLSVTASMLNSCLPFEVGRDETRVPIVPVSFDRGEIVLQEWLLVGPFSANYGTTKSVRGDLNFNYMQSLAQTEGHLRAPVLERAHQRLAATSPLVRAQVHKSSDEVVNFQDIYADPKNATVYGAVILQSDKEQDGYLLSGSAFGLRVWLNGQLVVDEDESDGHRSSRYRDFTYITLNKGVNFLLAKTVSTKHDWMLSMSLASPRFARGKAKEVFETEVLTANVISRNAVLEMHAKLYEGEEGRIEVRDLSGNVIIAKPVTFRGRISCGLPALPPGVYYLRVIVQGDVVEQPFYYGHTPEELHRKYSNLIKGYQSEHRIYGTLQALLTRFKHLLKPEHIRTGNGFWQRKLMFAIVGLETAVQALQLGRDPFRNVPGTHLRSYRSSIDDKDEHYQIHVPVSGPLYKPLVIIVPYISEPIRPFIESTHVARINVQKIARLADLHGYAVVWASARGGNTYGEAIGETDLFDMLRHVQAEYRIDPDRIYLVGTCSGAHDAIMLAARHPHRFAALGVITPWVYRQRLSEDTAVDPAEQYALSVLTANSPVSVAQNLSNIPMYINHAEKDNHTPLQQSYDFIAAAQKHRWEPTFELMKGGTIAYFPEDPWPKIFKFFSGKQRSAPSRITFVTTTLKYRRAYWIKIESVIQRTEPAEITAYIDSRTVRVRTKNVGSYSIDVAGLPETVTSDDLHVITNNTLTSTVSRSDPHPTIQIAPEEKVAPHTEISGPITDVFSSGVIVVRGTEGKHRAELQNAANGLAKSWRARYVSELPIVDDKRVDDTTLQKKNIVLLGSV